MSYRVLYDRVLRHVDAETAHTAGSALLRVAPVPRPLLRPDPCLRVRALGLDFDSPLGVAAGFDKGARTFAALGALGFGSVEVGTVTAEAQEGNPRPRVFRLPEQRALLNRMGFPNPGAAAVAGRLARARRGTVVGVNVGKTKRAEDAVGDFRASVALLAPLADYLVLNVSSPNTPGLRDLQAVDRLEELVIAVRDVCPVPLLVKVAPDLADAELDAIGALALRLGLDGLVATNTTAAPDGAGGISGAPLRARSLDVLRRLHAVGEGRLTLVSAGGVATADDVLERLFAGASLVQAYTAFVEGGPLWPSRINRELARRVRASRHASLAELIAGERPARQPVAA